jgi:hypothetical protein
MKPRGSATQTRGFVCDDAGHLTSASNPENGTVFYFYNADSTVWYKHDAKGQDAVYSYGGAKRVTMIQRYPSGKNNAEDTCQRVTYAYDANVINSAFSQHVAGRLATAQYSVYVAGHPANLTEMYSYHVAGAVTAKRLQVQRCGNCAAQALEADFGYDSAGRVASYGTATPLAPGTQARTYTYGFDGMGRPVTLRDNFATVYTTGNNNAWVQNDSAAISAVGERDHPGEGGARRDRMGGLRIRPGV